MTSESAPSAVCERLIPSFMLREATSFALSVADIRLAIACPAASSFALLMRMPDERRSMDWLKLAAVFCCCFRTLPDIRLLKIVAIGLPFRTSESR
ncbi:hypothetical protein BN131_3766 [Cronobacter malonaticus 681]|nr:hypothetical protein BN131_3766 [Cronobacter malonaticus 681]